MNVFLRAVPHWVSALALGVPVLAVAGVIGLRAHDRNLLENAKVTEHVTSLDRSIDELGGRKLTADTVYRTFVDRYRAAEQTALADTSRTEIPRAEVVALARSCSDSQRACERRAAIADSLADSLRAEVKLLKNWKAPKPPRITLFGEALYDEIEKACRSPRRSMLQPARAKRFKLGRWSASVSLFTEEGRDARERHGQMVQ